MEFPERWQGPLSEPILENPEGMGGHRKNRFRGGVWIFSGTAHSPCFYPVLEYSKSTRVLSQMLVSDWLRYSLFC